MPSSLHPQPSSYAYQFSAGVVDKFIEKYSRATIFFARKLWIEPKDWRSMLINSFMRHNAHWNVVRDCMKMVDNQDLYGELSKYTKEDFVKYLTAVRTIAEDWLLDEDRLRKRS